MAKGAQLSRIGTQLRKPWYAFWRLLTRSAYKDRMYTLQVPQGQRIYTPWYDLSSDASFGSLMHNVQDRGPVAVSSDRCYMLYQLLEHALAVPGDLAECGVYTGGTAHLLSAALSRLEPTEPGEYQHANRHIHLFDTFEGMPATSIPERDYHRPGEFSDTSLSQVQRRLSDYTNLCVFHPGWIPDTFADLNENQRFSFIHVDVDIYDSVWACCSYLWPRLSPGGVMIFDDYGFYPYRFAAKAAVDKFFATIRERPLILPTGQALVIKLEQ